MDQFVLLPLSVYNSNKNSTIVTKQDLPKCKPEQTPTYHKDTLKKEIIQQLSTSASLPVSKIIESPRIKLSNFNTLILNGTETGVLFKDSAQQLKRKNVPIPDIYFTLLDAASITPDIVVNSQAKAEERGAWIPVKIWTTKLQRLYTQGFAAYGSVRNLAKAAKLSVKGQRVFTFKDLIY